MIFFFLPRLAMQIYGGIWSDSQLRNDPTTTTGHVINNDDDDALFRSA